MISFSHFCMLFITCALSAAGIAKLIMISIEPGEIFSSWQKVLKWLKPVDGGKGIKNHISNFLYMRLGGCPTCTRQTIAELSFIVFYNFCHLYGKYPTYHLPMVSRYLMNICLFMAFCGTTLYLGLLLEYEKRQADNG